jgi:hypothetical protein
MLNESKHLKVNFGSLPVPANCQRTTWLNWLLESIKTDTATFVQVEDQTGNSRWELLDSTLVYRSESILFGFKTGAVYEAETGLRTVGGRRLSAEAYLDHLDRIPVTDINQMPFVILASHLVSRLDSIHKTQDHEWDHSRSQIVSEGDKWRVNLKVDSALSFGFIRECYGDLTLQLVPDSSKATVPSPRQIFSGESLELFA